MDEKFCVVLFYSTSLAIRAEKVAKSKGLKVKLIPTPRHLSTDCGTALRFSLEDKKQLIKALDNENVEYDKISPI